MKTNYYIEKEKYVMDVGRNINLSHYMILEIEFLNYSFFYYYYFQEATEGL